MVGRLESEHQDGRLAVARPGQAGLAGVEQPAVGGLQARLGQRAHRRGALGEAREPQRGRGPEARPGPDPHPGLGDHAEDPLGADQHAVGARPGARSRQPAALPHAPRGDARAPTRPGRRCAWARWRSGPPRGWRSSRRAWPARTTAGSGAASGRARAARPPARGPAVPAPIRAASETGSTSRTPARSAQVDRDRRLLEARLHPADDAGAAAVGNRRGTGRGAPVEHLLQLLFVAREGDRVGRVLHLAAEGAHHVAVGLAERVRSRACGSAAQISSSAEGGPSRGSGRSRSSTRAGRSTSFAPKPRCATMPAAAASTSS